jgi:hypothetical protein
MMDWWSLIARSLPKVTKTEIVDVDSAIETAMTPMAAVPRDHAHMISRKSDVDETPSQMPLGTHSRAAGNADPTSIHEKPKPRLPRPPPRRIGIELG